MPEARRSQAPPAARRTQILDAALACFSSQGYHATTMDDLVAKAGLSKGSLYWHFAGKEDVFLALFDRFAETLFQAWEGGADDDADALETLERSGRALLDQLEGQSLGAWFEFLHQPRARERMAEVYRGSRARIEGMLEAERAAGRLRPHAPEAVAVTLVAALEGLLLQAMVEPDFDARRHWEGLWDCLRLGLQR